MDKYFVVKDVYANSSMILIVTESLKSYLTEENKINWSDLYDQKSQKVKSEFQIDLVAEVKNNITSLKDSDAKAIALGICGKGISIYTKLAEFAPTGETDSSEPGGAGSRNCKLPLTSAGLQCNRQASH